MHNVVIEELEDHLAGRASNAFGSHLAQCGACRAEIAAMEEMSGALRMLRRDNGEAVAPRPGFYARVATGIVERERRTAWGLFAPGALFFRRVAFASLVLLAGLGTYLIANEPEFSVNDATAIMARQAPDTDVRSDDRGVNSRDQILLTLANWSE